MGNGDLLQSQWWFQLHSLIAQLDDLFIGCTLIDLRKTKYAHRIFTPLLFKVIHPGLQFLNVVLKGTDAVILGFDLGFQGGDRLWQFNRRDRLKVDEDLVMFCLLPKLPVDKSVQHVLFYITC